MVVENLVKALKAYTRRIFFLVLSNLCTTPNTGHSKRVLSL
jgi:hypothetical protein